VRQEGAASWVGVAAFDTAFHASLPEAAATYPLPWDWTERWGVRRFGFHGLSVQYALGRATKLLGAFRRICARCSPRPIRVPRALV